MHLVLVVEDDEDIRQLEQAVLECSGFEVHTAADGREALTQLRERRPSVVVLDLMMPGMDGLTFLRERNRDPELRNVPVLCVTAAGPEMIADARRLGACECLQKPTDLDHLCELVERYCRFNPAPRT